MRAAGSTASAQRTRAASGLLLCALGALLALADLAHAQNALPLTRNDFNLDLVTGPVIGSGRILGLGGAYTALAGGIEGAAWNPAAYASRSLWETNWWEWNGTFN